jgi:arylsulfatase A-like enzyme
MDGAARSRPNFLFIVTDQHRADYLGCAGHPVLETPNIDALASVGTRFDEFHVATPVCMPNRAALLTGRYPSVHGLRQNGEHLTYRANTFVDVLAANGYRTATIGKSHLQPMTMHPPERRNDPAAIGLIAEAWKDDPGDYGHETPERYEGNNKYEIPVPYYGYQEIDLVGNHGDLADGHYLQWLRERSPHADAWRDRNNQLPHNYSCPQAYRTPIPEHLYSTAYIRDRALACLERMRDVAQPFFVFVSFPDPHHPFTPPGKYWDMYQPEDFEVRLPWGSHRNPTPPMLHLRAQQDAGQRNDQGQEAFTAEPHEIREAMALTCGMIAMIDDAVGALVAKLRDIDKFDRTVIVFNSDHGDYLGDFGLLLKGAMPLRSINRVPFIWSDPDTRAKGVSRALASTIDLAPTILDRAGINAYHGIQGKSLLGNLSGSATLRDHLLIEHQDSFKRYGLPRFAVIRTLITSEWRYSVWRGESWGELYNLKNDPDETHNLWDDPGHRRVRRELGELLTNEMLENVDQSPHAKRRA